MRPCLMTSTFRPPSVDRNRQIVRYLEKICNSVVLEKINLMCCKTAHACALSKNIGVQQQRPRSTFQFRLMCYSSLEHNTQRSCIIFKGRRCVEIRPPDSGMNFVTGRYSLSTRSKIQPDPCRMKFSTCTLNNFTSEHLIYCINTMTVNITMTNYLTEVKHVRFRDALVFHNIDGGTRHVPLVESSLTLQFLMKIFSRHLFRYTYRHIGTCVTV